MGKKKSKPEAKASHQSKISCTPPEYMKLVAAHKKHGGDGEAFATFLKRMIMERIAEL